MGTLTETTTESLIFNSPYSSDVPGKTDWKYVGFGRGSIKIYKRRSY